jgi:hypothetical protein
MFLESFQITGSAVMQIFLMGAIGYFLMKKGMLGEAGLDVLSRLVVEVTLPILIFSQLIKGFRFDLYPDWWIYPILSLFITISGLILGCLFIGFIKGKHRRLQFLSLVAFQNSGYLPLSLIAALLPKDKADTMFIYLFLFLLGFNLIVWSFGVYLLSFYENKKFEIRNLFSPPVIATIIALAAVFFNLNSFFPDTLIKPLKIIGDCTLPLAMLVVGGSLSTIHPRHIDKKAMLYLILAKLIILPALGLWLVMKFHLKELIGLLILIELAVPPATSLSVITRHYKKEDLLIGQGILIGHVASIVTLPLFLSLYFIFNMIK